MILSSCQASSKSRHSSPGLELLRGRRADGREKGDVLSGAQFCDGFCDASFMSGLNMFWFAFVKLSA